ncbi:MAG: hypothetical protein A3C71_00390 [Candidatus Yanofskybacteria bacterium RIFCSPHIGHO2_02_FULL_43_15c]|uniref:Transcriptional regulator n=1 Tax=Candidatus Yanofskybacteria bacterium RIFCSPHIGHO2_02_FULL_43_15c TaxID=1802679 RepID=A0A1F8FL68_9BACT|nr:MAG: hypothetical protein A3C71_00390 [Candidatus Yanofskybacteria bacterium RIFCSPHIGHO2_02_FULL_43_15c]
MSGHSKWSQIKRQKEIADQKKGQLFSKLSKVISIAARKGTDPAMNVELKNAIEKAKETSMPKENVERAIKRVSDKNAARLEELVIEIIGPESLALIITIITDNKNRTMAEIKKILSEFGYKQGSVMWAFTKQGREFVPQYPIENLSEETKSNLEKLFERLDENEDVQEVYLNFI